MNINLKVKEGCLFTADDKAITKLAILIGKGILKFGEFSELEREFTGLLSNYEKTGLRACERPILISLDHFIDSANKTETERKFLLDSFPDLPYINGFYVKQGYLSIHPEVRISSKSPMNGVELTVPCEDPTSYVLCIKGEGDLSRTELEWELSKEEFDALQGMLLYPMVVKLYHRFKLQDGHIAECSRVDPGADHSFMYVDVEFRSEDESGRFIPPDCFGKEITFDKSFKMKNFLERTRKRINSSSVS